MSDQAFVRNAAAAWKRVRAMPGPGRGNSNAAAVAAGLWATLYADQLLQIQGDQAMNPLTAENTALRSLCAELVEACASMIRWDDAEKNARPFDEDNGAGFYARTEMCGEAFEKARAAIAHAKELLP